MKMENVVIAKKNMNISIKESMLIRKCLGAYVSSQLLDFDKSPLFMDLMTKLKKHENDSVKGVYVRKAIENESKINPNETNLHNAINNARRNQNKDIRKSLNKELKKYNFQTITNKKILELVKEERKERLQEERKKRLQEIASKHSLLDIIK
jgi:hypothetical protein